MTIPTLGDMIWRVGNHPLATNVAMSPVVQDRLSSRYVRQDADGALEVARDLGAMGVGSTLHLRGHPVQDEDAATGQVLAYRRLTEQCRRLGLRDIDISVKMEQLGYHVGGPQLARRNLARVVEHAAHQGVTTTVDMEYAEEVPDTLEVWSQVRAEWPSVGIALQASLRRTEQDCVDAGAVGARVRLCKGGYHPVEGQSHLTRQEIDKSYVRCAKRLLRSGAYPMFATHDPRLVAIVSHMALVSGRTDDHWELQTLQGVSPHLVEDALANGRHMRCYVPFGPNWYSWFLRRVSEKPSNLALLGRSVIAS